MTHPTIRTKLKRMVWNNPTVKARGLQTMLENQGEKLSVFTIATVRAEFLADLRLLRELNLLRNEHRKFREPVVRYKQQYWGKDSPRKKAKQVQAGVERVTALRFLRQPSRPNAPRPEAKSGRAAGKETGLWGGSVPNTSNYCLDR